VAESGVAPGGTSHDSRMTTAGWTAGRGSGRRVGPRQLCARRAPGPIEGQTGSSAGGHPSGFGPYSTRMAADGRVRARAVLRWAAARWRDRGAHVGVRRGTSRYASPEERLGVSGEEALRAGGGLMGRTRRRGQVWMSLGSDGGRPSCAT